VPRRAVLNDRDLGPVSKMNAAGPWPSMASHDDESKVVISERQRTRSIASFQSHGPSGGRTKEGGAAPSSAAISTGDRKQAAVDAGEVRDRMHPKPHPFTPGTVQPVGDEKASARLSEWDAKKRP